MSVMDYKWSGLHHLFMTMFLHSFATYMVIPAITDITMSALCPGRDECSLAIYLTGFQEAIIGLGTLVTMPLMGNLSDKYGRKSLLMVPMTLTIIPLGILAYSRTRKFFYVYYVFRTLIAMVCEGTAHCIAFAYVADNVPEGPRAAAFGIMSGIGSAAFVCGTLTTRFLSTSLTFQVAATVALLAAVYLKVFLKDSIIDDSLSVPIISNGKLSASTKIEGQSVRDVQPFKTMPSLKDMVSLLRSSPTFTQAAIVAFFSNLADFGLHGSIMYYLKAKFHFDKNQFADLMVISGVAGTISQLLFMPILAPAIGEARLLSVGLLFSGLHVPYAAAMFSILFVFAQPCMRSIVSKQVGPCEQGKAQGCISGLCSFAHAVSPLAFSPLTALFLSEKAPFSFPGFSIMCIGFASMLSFIQSVMMRVDPPVSSHTHK
ncbi:Hippocampus abundant transcript-like protein 1 [Quillaja saponaria]|uniref:Hippocampus abundant transcript-like protein 1 n=1 Tax=Quillaja saponaria TaxID=32244 RepID=A0AAD7LH81_QUISA|nr:Hippocampus abundant transcript-like protein 1 [Quillaja saponaria]